MSLKLVRVLIAIALSGLFLGVGTAEVGGAAATASQAGSSSLCPACW